MLELFLARLFEAKNLASFRIETRHDVTDRAILARAIHSLEDEENRVLRRCVVKLL